MTDITSFNYILFVLVIPSDFQSFSFFIIRGITDNDS
jgi:hypothetical protein